MKIRLGVKKEGSDEVCGEKECEEDGVDVPTCKNVLKLRVNLLKDRRRRRLSCHDCVIVKWPGDLSVRISLNFGKVNSGSEISLTILFTLPI